MAATPWFGGSNPSDDIELWNLSVCLSRVSLALFMRLRLVSVVGEFLWSGERPVDDDVQCFPGGHWSTPGEFAVTVMPAIYIDLASHWSLCGLHRNMNPAGTYLPGWRAPSWGQRPRCPFMKGHHDTHTHNGFKPQWRHWIMKLVCFSFSSFSSFVHGTDSFQS